MQGLQIWPITTCHCWVCIACRLQDTSHNPAQEFYLKQPSSSMTIPDISTLSRYVSPINPAVFPHLTLVLLGIGLFFTAWFFVYEVWMTCIHLRCKTYICRSHPPSSPGRSWKNWSLLPWPLSLWALGLSSCCSGLGSMSSCLASWLCVACFVLLMNVLRD